jgi:SAM-dependent methyltransferase
VVLDAGCRDGAHLIRLAQSYDAAGVGIEPVAIHVERARAAVAAAGLEQRIQIVQGTLEDCAYPDGYFHFVWCRDVLEQVEPLVPALRQMARGLKLDGRMLVYSTVATDLLEPGEAAYTLGQFAWRRSELTLAARRLSRKPGRRAVAGQVCERGDVTSRPVDQVRTSPAVDKNLAAVRRPGQRAVVGANLRQRMHVRAVSAHHPNVPGQPVRGGEH